MNTAELLIQLKDPDLDVKLMAIRRIGMAHDQNLVKHLLKLLLDPHPDVREATIISLGALGEPAIIKPVVNCLDDEDKKVQTAAIKVLGEMRTIQATKPLIRQLPKVDLNLKLAIIVALGQIQDKNAIFPLIDLLEDPDPNIRIKTLFSLGKFGDDRAVDPIIGQLKREPAVSQIAALTLGKYENKAIIPALVELLVSKNAKTREYAVIALGMQGKTEVMAPLLKMLNDEESGVRQAATTALSEFKDNKTVHHFVLRLSDPDKDIRATSARALGKIGDTTAAPRLKSLLRDSEESVQLEAVRSLGELRASEATKTLIKLLKNQSIELKKAAIYSIGQIEASQKHSDTVGKAVNLILGSSAMRPLNRLLNDGEMEIRAAAAVALAKINHNHFKFQKAAKYYKTAAAECLTWDYHQSYYEACQLGCEILDNISKQQYTIAEKTFLEIDSLLKSAAKLTGAQSFVSNTAWGAVHEYIKIHQSKKKEEFIGHFQDYGLKLMLIQKKLPYEYQTLVDTPQDNLNAGYQIINKRGMTIDEASEDIEALKSDLFELVHEILLIEPIKVSGEYDQAKTINILENMMINSDLSNQFKSPSAFIADTKLAHLVSEPEIPFKSKAAKNFFISEVSIDSDLQPISPFSISLVQLLKGARKTNPAESIDTLWEHNIERYYNLRSYKHERIYQFTKQAVNFRVKPKIIGFMDDAIYDDSILVIFPENSIPINYMEKLQGYADHYNLFIIAGFEHIQNEGQFYNRAYVIAPRDTNKYFQQKNTPSSFNFKQKPESAWKENFPITKPPEFKVFTAPFGKFMMFLGEDYTEYREFIPHIVEENQLDFIIFLSNNYEDEIGLSEIASLSNETSVPILHVNTGQFGGTGAFEPQTGIVGNRGLPIRDNSEAIFHWEFDPEASNQQTPSPEKTIKLPSHSKDALQEMLNKLNKN